MQSDQLRTIKIHTGHRDFMSTHLMRFSEKLFISFVSIPLSLGVNFDIRNWPIPKHLRGLGGTNLPRRYEELR